MHVCLALICACMCLVLICALAAHMCCVVPAKPADGDERAQPPACTGGVCQSTKGIMAITELRGVYQRDLQHVLALAHDEQCAGNVYTCTACRQHLQRWVKAQKNAATVAVGEGTVACSSTLRTSKPVWVAK